MGLTLHKKEIFGLVDAEDDVIQTLKEPMDAAKAIWFVQTLVGSPEKFPNVAALIDEGLYVTDSTTSSVI